MPIQYVPPELLLEVFTYYTLDAFLESGDNSYFSNGPSNLSEVCSAWRAIVLDNSTFWSSFNISAKNRRSDGMINLLRLWLARSRDVPLYFELAPIPSHASFIHQVQKTNDNFGEILDIFIDHAHQWRDVTISFPKVPVSESRPRKRLPVGGTPLLKRFSFDCVEDEYFRGQTDVTMPDIGLEQLVKSPNLRHLGVRSSALSGHPINSFFHLTNITSLRLRGAPLVALGCLCVLKNLNQFEFWADEGVIHPSTARVTHSRLETLNIGFDTQAGMDLLNHLHAPSLTTLVVKSPGVSPLQVGSFIARSEITHSLTDLSIWNPSDLYDLQALLGKLTALSSLELYAPQGSEFALEEFLRSLIVWDILSAGLSLSHLVGVPKISLCANLKALTINCCPPIGEKLVGAMVVSRELYLRWRECDTSFRFEDTYFPHKVWFDRTKLMVDDAPTLYKELASEISEGDSQEIALFNVLF